MDIVANTENVYDECSGGLYHFKKCSGTFITF